MSGKNARSGVHGTVTTGPSIGTGDLSGMGLCPCPPLSGLPSRPGVRILRDPFTHPSCVGSGGAGADERLAALRPGTVQAGSHGADCDVDGSGVLGVSELVTVAQ